MASNYGIIFLRVFWTALLAAARWLASG